MQNSHRSDQYVRKTSPNLLSRLRITVTHRTLLTHTTRIRKRWRNYTDLVRVLSKSRDLLFNTLPTQRDKLKFPHNLSTFSKNLVVYYCKWCTPIGYTTRYLFVNGYRVAASNATRSSFSLKKQCLFFVFRNNIKEITNTSLFLPKQLDYSLSISMKW